MSFFRESGASLALLTLGVTLIGGGGLGLVYAAISLLRAGCPS